jgi:hypothetical protein
MLVAVGTGPGPISGCCFQSALARPAHAERYRAVWISLKGLNLLVWRGEAVVFNRWGRPQSLAHLGSKGSSRSDSGTELMTNTKKKDDDDDLVRETGKG